MIRAALMLCLLLCLTTLPAAAGIPTSPAPPYAGLGHQSKHSTCLQPACIPTASALSSAGRWPSDPRLPQLGQRAVLGAEDRPSFLGDEQQTDSVEYRRWRIEQGVAEGRDEIEGGQL